MSKTSVWIKEQFAKESPRIVTEYSLQKQVDELLTRVKQLEEDTLETVNYNTSFISDARGNHDILDIDNNNIFSLIISPYEGKLLLFNSSSLIYSLENNQKGEILPISNGKIINNFQILDNIKKCQN